MSVKKRTLTAKDLYQIELVSGARLAPDGAHVVYAQHRVDRKTEKKYANLWVAPTDGGAPRQFTYGDQIDRAPEWAPDGREIAFLSNRGNADKPAQIYLIPFSGGEARPLTDIKGSIGSFVWAPDGKKLALTVRKTDAEALAREKDEQKKKLGIVARHYDRVRYKLDGFGYLPKEQTHLWVVEVSSGKASQLTDHPVYTEAYPAWSPDSRSLAFISNRSENPDFEIDRDDLFVIPAGGGELRKIPTPVGGKSHPSFSPDGRWIAYYGSEGEAKWYLNENLWLVAADGSSPARALTGAYDFHVSSWTINDLMDAELMPPAWAADGSRIAFPVARHGRSEYHSVNLEGEDLQTVIGEHGVSGSHSFDRARTRLAYTLSRLTDPGQIFEKNLQTGKTRQLTHLNRKLLRGVDLGEVEEVWYKGPAGNDLQGWIIRPPDFDPAKKYPSIIEIHGGPLTQYGFAFMHEFYFLAAHGYVVAFTNPRGGRGYGEEHAKAIWGGWGGADYEDMEAWADYVAALPYIDFTRMGVTGGSYGGYMTLWIIGHTHRFKAAVAQRCVSNLVSLWGSSDFNWGFQQILGDQAPFENLQKFWDHSPMKYIGNAQTPTLVIHSENDMRCPIEQGEQAFVALKKLGVPSEMVRFPDEPHGLSRVGRTDRRIARLDHIVGWFERYLK